MMHIESSANLSVTNPHTPHLAEAAANDNSAIRTTNTPNAEQSKFWIPFLDSDGTGVRSWRCLDVAEGISERVKKVFSNGQCHSFAIALHELTEWPILGFCNEGRGRWIPRHFVVEPVDLLRGTTFNITIDVMGALGTDAICHSRYVTISEIQKWTKRGVFLPMNLPAARHFAPHLLRTMDNRLGCLFSTNPLWPKYQRLFSSLSLSQSYPLAHGQRKSSTCNNKCLVPECGKSAQPDSPHCRYHQPTLPIFHEAIAPMLEGTSDQQNGSKHAVC